MKKRLTITAIAVCFTACLMGMDGCTESFLVNGWQGITYAQPEESVSTVLEYVAVTDMRPETSTLVFQTDAELEDMIYQNEIDRIEWWVSGNRLARVMADEVTSWPTIQSGLFGDVIFEAGVNQVELKTYLKAGEFTGNFRYTLEDFSAKTADGWPMTYLKDDEPFTPWYHVLEQLRVDEFESSPLMDGIDIRVVFNRQAYLYVSYGPPEDPYRYYTYVWSDDGLTYEFTIDDLVPDTDYSVKLEAHGWFGGHIEWEVDEHTLPDTYLHVPEQYPTIQNAINAAVSGDTVKIAPGWYEGPITLKSGVTISGSGVYGADQTFISSDDIYTMKGSNSSVGCVIENCWINNHYVGEWFYHYGAVVGDLGFDIELRNCLVESNLQGVSVNYADLTVTNSTFVAHGLEGQAINIYCGGTNPAEISNSIIWGQNWGVFCQYAGTDTISDNNIFWNNTHHVGDCVSGSWMEADPLFADPDWYDYRPSCFGPGAGLGAMDCVQ